MVYIFLAMGFYTAAIMFISAASRHLNTILATGIINFVGAILPLTLSIALLTKKTVVDHKFGIYMALLAGVCIGFFGMANVKSYSLNKVGVVTPIVFGGAIVLSTLLSMLIFKQKLTMLEGLGLGIVALGLGVIIYARATV